MGYMTWAATDHQKMARAWFLNYLAWQDMGDEVMAASCQLMTRKYYALARHCMELI